MEAFLLEKVLSTERVTPIRGGLLGTNWSDPANGPKPIANAREPANPPPRLFWLQICGEVG